MTSKPLSHPLFTVFFWIFHSALLLVVYAGFLPFLAPSIVVDAIAGEVPLNMLLPFVGLILLPTFCVAIAVIPKWRRLLPPMQVFYGIEAPLLILCLVRFFWLRDLTPGTTLLLIVAAVGTVAVALWLHKAIHEPDTAAWWHVVGLSVMLTIALYLLALSVFYLLPLVVMSFIAIPLILYAMVLSPLIVLLLGFWTMPLGMTIVYFQAWRKSVKQFAAEHGKWGAIALTTTVLALWIGLVVSFQQQPQNQAFALLEKPPQTEQARQTLLQKSDLIRQGLLNAYLAPYRYPWYQDTHVYDLYRFFLNFSEVQAKAIQDWHSTLTSPFRYGGKMGDMDKAANLYAQFFDTPILRGELPAIQTAVQSTFMRWEAKASLLDINERRVWLAEQELRVKPQGDWADIELHEVYRNQTSAQEEILYYFSLPESAVITGLWLGETGDRANSFPYTVSPRGAAQQIYNQEVNRRVDPALLEQVGPRNYRLRAFPIPPQGTGEMHLWLTYKVLQQGGEWPLPQLHEQRNIYWTKQTKRRVNSQAISGSERWLPDTVAADNAQPTTHQAMLADRNQVEAAPLTQAAQLPTGKRFAVILDDSYSMTAHRSEVEQTFRWLQDKIVPQNAVELYLTATSPATPKRFDQLQAIDPAKVVFYGSLQPRQMLQQFLTLRGDRTYDAVLLITDAGSYELTEDSKTVLAMPAPLWFVHLGGLQAAYDDATLQAMQDSGGSSTTQVQEVMQRIGTQSALGTTALNVVDGYVWSQKVTPTAIATQSSPATGFAPLAARQWVTHLSRTERSNQPEKLDAIHAVAKQHSIVTPYSSMIVLVNDQQRRDLKQAEQGRDRFEREVEDQQLPQPNPMAPVPAVPEPAEWLLLLVGAIVLGLAAWLTQRLRPELKP